MKVQLTTLQQEVITEMIGCDESKSLTIMVEGKEIVEYINYDIINIYNKLLNDRLEVFK